jgi:hypothetical protein
MNIKQLTDDINKGKYAVQERIADMAQANEENDPYFPISKGFIRVRQDEGQDPQFHIEKGYGRGKSIAYFDMVTGEQLVKGKKHKARNLNISTLNDWKERLYKWIRSKNSKGVLNWEVLFNWYVNENPYKLPKSNIEKWWSEILNKIPSDDILSKARDSLNRDDREIHTLDLLYDINGIFGIRGDYEDWVGRVYTWELEGDSTPRFWIDFNEYTVCYDIKGNYYGSNGKRPVMPILQKLNNFVKMYLTLPSKEGNFNKRSDVVEYFIM